MRAIEIAKAGGPKDDAELRELALWSGWGAVPQLFEPGSDLSKRFGPKLAELLDDEELALASATTPNAHYTSPMVAEAIWALAAKLGFKQGAVIEPGCGAGVFMATAPDGTHVTGIEKDTTTAAICQAAHPAHTVIAADLADVSRPGHFDLAVGNVPFSGIVKPYDPVLSADRAMNLHNYALAKALHCLRPGALLVAVTSTGTLDATNPAQRERLGQLGQFLGAIRLPAGAFERQSGTGVTTDIVVFQRRGHDGDGPAPAAAEIEADTNQLMAPWRDTAEATRPDGGPFMKPARAADDGTRLPPEPHFHNRWYADHPDLVLGDWDSGGLYAGDQLMVRYTGDDLAADLGAAIDRLAGRINLARPLPEPALEDREDRTAAIDPPPGWQLPVWAQEGSIFAWKTRPGSRKCKPRYRFARVDQGRLVAHSGPAESNISARTELALVCFVRDAHRDLTAGEAADLPDAELDRLRETLGERRRSFVAHTGRPLSHYKVQAPSRAGEDSVDATASGGLRRVYPKLGGFAGWAGSPADPDYLRVIALDDYSHETGECKEADILSLRVNTPPDAVVEVATLADAVAASMGRHGRLDMGYMADICAFDWSPDDLADQQVAYLDPYPAGGGPPRWEPAPRYLSGDVRAKLKLARRAAAEEGGERYARNVVALAVAVPDDVEPSDIALGCGAPWLPEDDVRDFICDTLDITSDEVMLSYSPDSGWVIGFAGTLATQSEAMASVWGTEERPAPKLLAAAWANRKIEITQTQPDGSRAPNHAAIAAARAKIDKWNAELRRWAFDNDPARADRLAALYNDTYNCFVAPVYPAGWLGRPAGLIDSFSLRDHQSSAVCRILHEGDVLLAHTVGAGKTAVMATAAMEMRRLGTCTKPLIVVPNHLVAQFCREMQTLYPDASILMPEGGATPSGQRKRKEFIARAMNGDWDAIVIPLSFFNRLPVSPSVVAAYNSQRIADLAAQLRGEQENGTRGAASKARQKVIEQVLENRRQENRDLAHRQLALWHQQGVAFEELGVDYIFVDEAHCFKNLPLVSQNSDFAQSSPSVYAQAMELKAYALRTRNRELGVNRGALTFATGTPVTNAPWEIYVMQRFLQPGLLRERRLWSFDSWASAFAEVVSRVEPSPRGSDWRVKERLRAYKNLPELAGLLSLCCDIKTADDLDLDRPALAGGGPETVLVPGSPQMVAFQEWLQWRSENLGDNPQWDNMLSVCNDGRKATLDLRLVGARQPSPSKIDACAERVAQIRRNHADRRFTDPATGQEHPEPGAFQVVFCDLGTPGDHRAFSVYDALAHELEARGVPRSEIEFVHNHDTPASKDALFRRCRQGDVSVLVASTAKAGTGVNIQTRLVALHHLDPAWTPANMEQREGRIVRAGNQFDEVQIIRYCQESSFDTFMYATLDSKAQFIAQFLSGRHHGRTMEYEDGADASGADDFAAAMAVSSGDPRVVRRAELNHDIKEFELLREAHDIDQWRTARRLKFWHQSLPAQRDKLRALKLFDGTQHTAESVRIAGGRALSAEGGDSPDDQLRYQIEAVYHSWEDAETHIADIGDLEVAARHVVVNDMRAVEVRIGPPDAKVGFTIEGRDIATGRLRPATRVANSVNKIPQTAAATAAEIDRIAESIPQAEKRLHQDWPREQELRDNKIELRKIEADLYKNPIERDKDEEFYQVLMQQPEERRTASTLVNLGAFAHRPAPRLRDNGRGRADDLAGRIGRGRVDDDGEVPADDLAGRNGRGRVDDLAGRNGRSRADEESGVSSGGLDIGL